MSIAWTSVLIIVFLFPGILFYVGLYFRDRIPREVVRAGVIGEIAGAVFVSIVIHFTLWCVIKYFNFDANLFFNPLFSYEKIPTYWWVNLLDDRINRISIYIIASGLFGFILGLFIGLSGLITTHRWAAEVRGSQNMLVTAYVMTQTSIEDRVVMYRGAVNEIYLKSDGSISYLILNDCKKFYMHLENNSLKMGEQLNLFGSSQDDRQSKNLFTIDSSNIANILFEKSLKISVTENGTAALEAALEELATALQAQAN